MARGRRRAAIGAALLLGAGVVAGCGARSGETAQIVETVGLAVAYPRQDTADGFARAIAATTAGRDGRVTVLDAEQLDAQAPEDDLARIRVLVYVAGAESGFSQTPDVTRCYDMYFSVYELTNYHEADCPESPVAYQPPPPDPVQALPAGADRALARILRGLPDSVSSMDVLQAVDRGMPDPGDDAYGRANLPPSVTVTVRGGDVGVAAFAAGDRSCLLGVRLSGRVHVFRGLAPPPGEGGCAAEDALAAWASQPSAG